MKKIILCFLCLINFLYSIGNHFVEDFDDNSNKWYINSNKNEEIYIEKGNYIIKNLDEASDLSLTTSKSFTDFFALEYLLKGEKKEGSLYGIFIELESTDKFYFVLNEKSIGYFYEKDKKISLLDEFSLFPYLFEDYNSIVFVKDLNSFTFLVNEIPTEKIWAIKGSKIKKIGIYLNNLTNVYLDKYTEFSLGS